MNICSFETAKKLKEAGYPQPEFSCWQMWYNELGIGTFIGLKTDIKGIMYFDCYNLGSGTSLTRWLKEEDKTTFAPTVDDILMNLGCVYLSKMKGDYWGVFEKETNVMVSYHPENPAEACAEAYLYGYPKSMKLFDNHT